MHSALLTGYAWCMGKSKRGIYINYGTQKLLDFYCDIGLATYPAPAAAAPFTCIKRMNIS